MFKKWKHCKLRMPVISHTVHINIRVYHLHFPERNCVVHEESNVLRDLLRASRNWSYQGRINAEEVSAYRHRCRWPLQGRRRFNSPSVTTCSAEPHIVIKRTAFASCILGTFCAPGRLEKTKENIAYKKIITIVLKKLHCFPLV